MVCQKNVLRGLSAQYYLWPEAVQPVNASLNCFILTIKLEESLFITIYYDKGKITNLCKIASVLS